MKRPWDVWLRVIACTLIYRFKPTWADPLFRGRPTWANAFKYARQSWGYE